MRWKMKDDRYKKIKKRIITLLTVFVLFLIYVMIGSLYIYGYISIYPRFCRTMLVTTMIYTFFGCVLQTIGKNKLALAGGYLSFIILCICLVYSITWYDFLVFGICTYVVLYKSSHMCDDLCNR